MKENKQACLLSALQQTLDSAATFWMLIYKHSITALTSNNRAKKKKMGNATVHSLLLER
jgi:hypothetical protein